VQDKVFEMVKDVNALGVSVLMVEQRARQCLAVAEYGYVLEQGRNRLEGPAGDLLVNPEVIRLFRRLRSLDPSDSLAILNRQSWSPPLALVGKSFSSALSWPG